MSGTLPQYRPESRPTDEVTGVKVILKPGGVFKNGRCVEWRYTFVPRYRHELTPRLDVVRPSKHARGRIRPRTAKEQRRARNRIARFTQISKSFTIDQNTMRAMHDEVPA